MGSKEPDNACENHNDELRVFRGTLAHSTKDDPMQILDDFILGVRKGKILFLAPSSDITELTDRYGFQLNDVHNLQKGQFLIPGFVDTHIHAPQYVYSGTGTELPLLEWLQKYTFPIESKFKDVNFASSAYNDVVRRTLRYGTTTACYFATIHARSSLKLAEITAKLGQRAFVGKVNMDTHSPEFYVENTQESIRDTEWFIQQVRDLDCPRVAPIITPRFAISCTSHLMTELGSLAKKYDAHIQTHMDESIPEVEKVKELFPKYPNYARLYDAHGLINNKTVLAHSIYMDDDEVSLIKERGAGISHCPCSNFTVRSGVLNVRQRLQQGVKVSLGTDVSGGYSSSMLVAMRQAMIASNIQGMKQHLIVSNNNHTNPTKGEGCQISFKEAFRLATLGGSEVLGLDDRIGNFEVGKEFDALLVDPYVQHSPFNVYNDVYTDSIQDIIQKFIFLGDDRNIAEVYVGGKKLML